MGFVVILLATLATFRLSDLGAAGGVEGDVPQDRGSGPAVQTPAENGVSAAGGRTDSRPQIREHGEGLVAFRGLGPERWYARWKALRELLAVRADGLVGLIAAFLCVHSHEAESWSTSTGNGYYGGLQFDLTFQRTYAPDLLREKGTADHWSAGEQIAVAIEAHATRGFWPWPRTARMCGLLP